MMGGIRVLIHAISANIMSTLEHVQIHFDLFTGKACQVTLNRHYHTNGVFQAFTDALTLGGDQIAGEVFRLFALFAHLPQIF